MKQNLVYLRLIIRLIDSQMSVFKSIVTPHIKPLPQEELDFTHMFIGSVSYLLPSISSP